MIRLPDLSSYEELSCPQCEQGYLHQRRVEVFNRPSEDANSVAVTIDGCDIPRLGAQGRNPSGRRQGLLIYFECEHCDLQRALALAQHKGMTFVGWVRP